MGRTASKRLLQKLVAERRFQEGQIQREQWDFSTVDDSELQVCLDWEYRCEISEFREAVATARSAPSKGRWFDVDVLQYRFLSQWPETPFSQLTKRERRLIILELENDEGLPMEMAGAIDMERDGNQIPLAQIQVLLNYAEKYGVESAMKVAKDYWSGLSCTSRDGLQNVMLHIDLRKSPDFLTKAFRELIRMKRAACEIEIEETRGAGNAFRQQRTKLKWLGALRLLKVMSWENAYLHTHDLLGKGLFGDRPELWHRAKKLANNELEARKSQIEI